MCVERLDSRDMLTIDFAPVLDGQHLDLSVASRTMIEAESMETEMAEVWTEVPQWQLWAKEVAKRVSGNVNYQVDETGNVLAINPNTVRELGFDKPDTDKTDSDNSDSDFTRLAPPFPLSQTFQLHSLFGANHTIYLDFNGHTTNGTLFNSQLTSGNPIVTPPFSLDGSNLFSDLELEMIQKIWERVAEDFRPFHVNVTTQEPAAGMLIRSGSSDTLWGVRVVVGPETWYPGSPGGAAYVGSFNWNSDTPAFVFTNHLGNGEKNIAEAISHEVGHALGLSHDGRNSDAYYEGHGSGPTGWAPIMGNGYYRELTQWSRGEYPGANNTEDDLLIITSTGGNGFGYRADDHGNNALAASILHNVNSTVSATGVIERNTDVDYFRFTVARGNVTLDIQPFYRSPNLDILARVHDSIGTVIATSNPLNSLGASFNLNLNPNSTYYLSVTGTGKPASITENGYSDYASLGAYTIQGTIAPHLPDLAGWWSDVLAENLSWGQTFNLFGQVRNLGAANASAPFYQGFYLSGNQIWGDADDILLGRHYHAGPVLAGGFGEGFTIALTLPSSPPAGYSSTGTFYIGMRTDDLGNIAESNESNNGPGFYPITYDWDSFAINPASLVNSAIFYGEWNGWGPGLTDKVLAREGAAPQTLSYSNLLNTAAGITSLSFYMDSLTNVNAISASDFEFQVSPLGAFDELANPPSNWMAAEVMPTVTAGRGFGTSSTISMAWPPQSILNRWLRVTLKANQNTGLVAPEVFYVGHLLGETTGASNGIYTVSFADVTEIRSRVGQDATSSSWYDIDKNALVSFADISAMRGNIGTQLANITIPALGGGAGGSAAVHGSSGGSASRAKKLSLPTQKLHSVAPLVWGPAVDQVWSRRNIMTQTDDHTLQSPFLGNFQLVATSQESEAAVSSGFYSRLSRGSEANLPGELETKPLASMERNFASVDKFFDSLTGSGG